MKRKCEIVLCTLLMITTCFSVIIPAKTMKLTSSMQPEIAWEKTYGGDRIDWGNCIQQTTDGGYVISGTYYRNAWALWYSYFYLLKIDAYGNEEWNQTYGPYDGEHISKCVRQINDGGYIVAGFQGITYRYDAVVQKIDANGILKWEKTFGEFDAYDKAHSVQQTADGGYVITGLTNSYGAVAGDAFLIKLTAGGTEEWVHTYGGSESDAGYWVEQTDDGGFIIVGETYSFGMNGDVYLVKTDSSGNEEWNKTFGENGWDGGYSVNQTSDLGYIITGWCNTMEKGKDIYLIKTDTSGNEQWTNLFGGTNDDEGYSVQQTVDGGYFITGHYFNTTSYSCDVYMLKTNALGNEEWHQILDKENAEDRGYYGIQTSDGGYIVTGYTGNIMEENADVWVIRLETENQAPNIPEIEGEAQVKKDQAYEYSFVTTDPNDDPIRYNVKWGDGTSSGWTEFIASGTPLLLNHSWKERGTYEIKVKAKDPYGAESDWGTLEIEVPKNAPRPYYFIFRMIERIMQICKSLVTVLGL